MAPACITVMFSELAAGQQVQRQQPGEYGAPGRLVDREERLLHREQAEQQPDVGGPGPGLQPEQRARRDQPDGRADQQGAPVEDVREGAAPEPEDHERDEAEDTGQPDVRRGAGLRVDLCRHRHHGELCADDRDDVGGPEPPEVPVAQRSGVGEEALQDLSTSARTCSTLPQPSSSIRLRSPSQAAPSRARSSSETSSRAGLRMSRSSSSRWCSRVSLNSWRWSLKSSS